MLYAEFVPLYAAQHHLNACISTRLRFDFSNRSAFFSLDFIKDSRASQFSVLCIFSPIPYRRTPHIPIGYTPDGWIYISYQSNWCDIVSEKRYILENVLPSGLYVCLLRHKEGISPYGLAKEYYTQYWKQHSWSPNKVYPTLAILETLGLISRQKKQDSKRETSIVKPNFKGFAKALSDNRLPDEHKFDEADIEDIAGLLENADLSAPVLADDVKEPIVKVYDYAKRDDEFGVLDRMAITLKTGTYLATRLHGRYDKSNLNISKYARQFEELHEDLKAKLMFLRV